MKIEFLQALREINWIFLEPRCQGDYEGGIIKTENNGLLCRRSIANNDALVRNNISSLFPQTIGALGKLLS